MTAALVGLLILTTFFTAGGINLLALGELSGLPLTVGGAVLQLAAITLVVASWHVRRTLNGQTVARSSLLRARRASGCIRRVTLATIIALFGYGVIRLAFGDPLSLLTACVIGIGLFLLARGSKSIGLAQDQALSPGRGYVAQERRLRNQLLELQQSTARPPVAAADPADPPDFSYQDLGRRLPTRRSRPSDRGCRPW